MEISKPKRLLLKSILPVGAMASLGSVGLLTACGGARDKGVWGNGGKPDSVFDATDANRVAAFSNLNLLEPTVTVKGGTPGPAWVASSDSPIVHTVRGLVDGYVNATRTAGVLVLKNGQIVCERYKDINKDTKWTTFSIAKSFVGTLVAAAVTDKKLTLQDQISIHLPDLANSAAYGDVTVGDLLQMRSGVQWVDNIGPHDNLRELLVAARTKSQGAVLKYMVDLSKSGGKGDDGRYPYNYNSGDTHVLGAVLEAATGTPLNQYLSDKVWKPAGMEADGYWWSETEGGGTAFGGGGLSATLRDYGRFGEFIRTGAIGNAGASILPENWMQDAAADSFNEFDHSHNWYFPDDGGESGEVNHQYFFANGIYGQEIHIDQKRERVVVVLSHWSEPRPMDSQSQLEDFVESIMKA